MLRIGLKLNKVAEVLKIKNPEIRKNILKNHTPVGVGGSMEPLLDTNGSISTLVT